MVAVLIECLLYAVLFSPETCPEWKAGEETEAQRGGHTKDLWD